MASNHAKTDEKCEKFVDMYPCEKMTSGSFFQQQLLLEEELAKVVVLLAMWQVHHGIALVQC